MRGLGSGSPPGPPYVTQLAVVNVAPENLRLEGD
jgi:hypothetical protein